MFLTETARHCSVCNTVTPHSHGRFSPALLAAFFFAALGGALFILAPPVVVGGLVFLFIVITSAAFARERKWNVECKRCRDRARREIKKTKPGKHTEVNVL